MSIIIDKFNQPDNGYFMTILGNGGEEQLAIGMSYSQASKSPLIAVAMSVDGGCEIVSHHAWVDHSSLPLMVAGIIERWSTGGVKQSDLEAAHNKAQIGLIMAEMFKEE